MTEKLFLTSASSSSIDKTSLSGKELTQVIVGNLSVQSIIVSPKEIRDLLYSKFGYGFDAYHSVVLFDKNTKQVYGYILAHLESITDTKFIFQNNPGLVKFLENSVGLYISHVVLHNEIKDTPLLLLLNTIHALFCDSQFKKYNLYVWMDKGEIIFTPTQQFEPFFYEGLNKVSKAFYDICAK